MFGQHDDQQNNVPTPDGALGDQGMGQAGTDNAQSAPPVHDNGSNDSQNYIMTDAPGQQQPAADDSGMSSDSADNTAGTTVEPTAGAAGLGQDDLLNIKQQALQQLTPLVGHLDQSPEEKFRTTMMMIQASDNDNLIREAYSAAQNITDEKARAQALLDIVNEINYFTAQHPDA